MAFSPYFSENKEINHLMMMTGCSCNRTPSLFTLYILGRQFVVPISFV